MVIQLQQLGYIEKDNMNDCSSFIDCPNEKCKMVGYWKVYHNVEEAKNIFRKYDKIKNNIIRMMLKGTKPTEILNNNIIFQYVA